MKTKLGCCRLLLELELLETEELELDAPDEEALKSIQGTATCFPDPNELEEEIPVELELPEVEELLLGLVLLLLLGLVLLLDGDVLLLDGDVLLLDGDVLLELPPLEPDTEITANSSRPELGFMIVSLIVPIWLPELPITEAPVNWLPRTASCPILPVAL